MSVRNVFANGFGFGGQKPRRGTGRFSFAWGGLFSFTRYFL